MRKDSKCNSKLENEHLKMCKKRPHSDAKNKDKNNKQVTIYQSPKGYTRTNDGGEKLDTKVLDFNDKGVYIHKVDYDSLAPDEYSADNIIRFDMSHL